MDLITSLGHKRGKKVLVNGNLYPIDKDGILKGATDEDAGKLLQSSTWHEYDPEASKELLEQRKADLKKKGGGIQLLDGSGDPVKLPEPPEDSNPPSQSEDENEEGDEDENEEGDEDENEEGEGSEEESGYPDPDESMSIDYLREMADAYEVSYGPRATKKSLVKKIHQAMYS